MRVDSWRNLCPSEKKGAVICRMGKTMTTLAKRQAGRSINTEAERQCTSNNLTFFACTRVTTYCSGTKEGRKKSADPTREFRWNSDGWCVCVFFWLRALSFFRKIFLFKRTTADLSPHIDRSLSSAKRNKAAPI